MNVAIATINKVNHGVSGPYIAGGRGGAVAPARKTIFFSNIVFDFVGLFLVDILVRNLSLPPQTKNPRYGPVYVKIQAIYIS